MTTDDRGNQASASRDELAAWLDARAKQLTAAVLTGDLVPIAGVSRRWSWRWDRARAKGITKGNKVEATSARRMNEMLTQDLRNALGGAAPRELTPDTIARLRRTPDATSDGAEIDAIVGRAVAHVRAELHRNGPDIGR
jgi:hypothetical protein